MKNIILLITILCLFNSLESFGASSTVATIEYTTGIDDGTDTLLSGSDWILEIAPTYESECYDISPDLTFYKSTLVNVTSYIDRDLSCSTATHAGFEDETYIDWVDMGYEQLEDFGIEEITCPIYGDCEMSRVVNTEDKYFAEIPLDNGEDGTSNGAAKIFTTILGNVTASSTPGQGGEGAANDLASISSVERYCVDITDALSSDATTSTSKTPYASVHVYNWLPFKVGAGGANGADAPSGKKIEIYEGLSPTTISRLKQEYVD